ncbi:MAG: F0F1 ATP synthase subunit epsilon [Clostridia bacterium]|nr:F0F1 ATP synthase subunit epsilon [Clostridia bacterium]
MRDAFRLRILSPEGVTFDGEAVQISLTGSGGSLSVRAGHIPLVTATKAGVCRVWTPDSDTVSEFDCGDGILSVSNDAVTLVCDFVSEK